MGCRIPASLTTKNCHEPRFSRVLSGLQVAARGGRAAMRFFRERKLELRGSDMVEFDAVLLQSIKDSCVVEVDISDCTRLTTLPLRELCALEHLVSSDLTNSSKMYNLNDSDTRFTCDQKRLVCSCRVEPNGVWCFRFACTSVLLSCCSNSNV